MSFIRVGLHKLTPAISLVFLIVLIFICCVMFTVNDSEIVDCGQHRSMLSLCLHIRLGRRECPCSRKRLIVCQFLSIIVIILVILKKKWVD